MSRYNELGINLDIRNIYNGNLEQIERDFNQAMKEAGDAKFIATNSEQVAIGAENEVNKIVHRVDSVQEQVNTLSVEGDSSVESAQARTNLHGITYDTLKQRLDKDQELAEWLRDINPSSGAIWTPPVMPATRRGIEVPSGYDPDEHLDALMEPLLQEDPEYVTRTDLGLDQSGLYTIRRYDFTPKHYEKTVILTACIHGNEYTGFYALAQFLGLLVRNWHEHPQLVRLRKNIRFITIPIINMWGFANQKRQNVNGVDISRNFPKYWDDFKSGEDPASTYYKGTAPLSEAEAVIVDNMLNEFSEATAHVDCHTTTVVDGKYVLYLPRMLENKSGGYEKLVQAFLKEGEQTVWAFSRLPEFTTHSCYYYKMNVCNPEFVNDSTQIRSSAEMTRAVRWYGNVIMEASKMEKPQVEVLSEPYVKVVKYNNNGTNPIGITNTIYNNIDQTKMEFRVKTLGILSFDGSLTFTLDQPAKVGFFVHIYQQNHNDFGYAETKDNPVIEIYRDFDAGIHTIPLNQSLFTLTTGDDPIRPGNAVIRLRGKVSGTATATIENYQGRITFSPATSGLRHEIYDATGNELLGVDAMQKVFPY